MAASPHQQSEQVTLLKAEVDRLMFLSENDPVVMTKDCAKFMHVMSAFHNYEKVMVLNIQC